MSNEIFDPDPDEDEYEIQQGRFDTGVRIETRIHEMNDG